MSAINGDKARFHRGRKAKIARRARKRQLLLERKDGGTNASSGPKASR